MGDFNIHNWQAKFLKEGDEQQELDGVVNQKLVSKLLTIFDQIQADLGRKGIETDPDELIEYISDQIKIYTYGL